VEEEVDEILELAFGGSEFEDFREVELDLVPREELVQVEILVENLHLAHLENQLLGLFEGVFRKEAPEDVVGFEAVGFLDHYFNLSQLHILLNF
jgi:hypothetical protein